VKGVPVFNAIALQHYITPILHLTIGKGNNVLDNYVAELQAVAEDSTDEHYALEKAEAQATATQLDVKDELTRFNMVTSKYEKDLKQQQQRRTLSDEDQLIVKSEMSDIVGERTLLQDAVPRTKANLLEAKKLFGEEKKSQKMERLLGNQSIL
jgi:hydroxylamine reductase (hybrid-cluster protein)